MAKVKVKLMIREMGMLKLDLKMEQEKLRSPRDGDQQANLRQKNFVHIVSPTSRSGTGAPSVLQVGPRIGRIFSVVRKSPRDPGGVPGLSLHWGEGREEYSVVLVGKDREAKLILAHVVPCKGAEIDWVAEQVCRHLKKFGLRGDVNVKTDQEPALVDLVNKICSSRPDSRAVTSHSDVGDSKGNGLAERAVQQVEGMIRAHKLAVESRMKAMLPVNHPLLRWLVEHAADVLNRYNVGRDGRTPYQRLKGRRFVGNMLEFGAPVMFRVSGKVAGGIMQERWFPGIWVGKKLHTDEHMVMKEDGLVVRSRAVRETSVELNLQDYDKLKSTPHDPLGTIRSAISSTMPPVPLKGQDDVKKFRYTRVLEVQSP
jgi:hypothetical protein